MDNFCYGMSTVVVHIDRYNVLLTKVDAQCDKLATVVGKLTIPATVDVRLTTRAVYHSKRPSTSVYSTMLVRWCSRRGSICDFSEGF